MTKILDGKRLSEDRAAALKKRIAKMPTKPTLAIIQVGDLEESNRYIKNKIAFAEKIGAQVVYKKYPKNVSLKKLVSDISKCSADKNIHGIVVQLPIPSNIAANLDESQIFLAIHPIKDVDGLTSQNIKILFDNSGNFIPATTKGIVTLLDHYKMSVAGKKVVIVGESALIGRPTALVFLNKKATVTVCHTGTKNLKEETKRADILIVATGHPHLITRGHVSRKQIVIDVGFNVLGKNEKIVGDVDYENVKNIVGAITPVPGGVGPMTVLSLFENLVDSYEKLR